MEFYEKILQRAPGNHPLLSGIVGDAWAGSIKLLSIKTPDDLVKLGYSHEVNADKSQMPVSAGTELKKQYFEANEDTLNDPVRQVITVIRFKMILLCYLLKIPASYGFRPWSPFLDLDLVMSMMSLPPDRRQGRLWQAEYFRKSGVSFEDMNLRSATSNTMDMQALKNVGLRPLDEDLLRDVVKPGYVRWINARIAEDPLYRQIINRTINSPAGSLMRKFGLKDERLKAYNAYITLRPIENLLMKSQVACKGGLPFGR
jgi:hypothetical protein